MLLNETENKKVWDRVYGELGFRPGVKPETIPFAISRPYVVYDISKMTQEQIEQMDGLVMSAFIRCAGEGGRMYALDWQHSGFWFEPGNPEDRKSVWVEDKNYTGGGYDAYFPGVYPDGDYYFFIDCDFRFGFLGHPWQQKIWVFGESLLKEMKAIEKKLGMVPAKEAQSRKKKIYCYIYEGMADFEISLLLHRLKNTGGREIITVSEDTALLTAQSGLRYIPDKRITDVQITEDTEGLIIPGGPINNEQNAICPVAAEMLQSGKLVAAICFGPQFLGRAGLLKHYRYTTSCSPEKIRQLGCKDPFYRKNYVEERVVADKNLITAKGIAFVDFAMAVCEYMKIFDSEAQAYEQLGRVKE